MASNDDDELQLQAWYDRKSALMEASLGKEHNVVMHAIIPYSVGGALDLYYYPNSLPGTPSRQKNCRNRPAKARRTTFTAPTNW